MVRLIVFFLISVLVAVALAQTTCKCRENLGSCNPIFSNGDGTCDTVPRPCTGCVCDVNGFFDCEVRDIFVYRFNTTESTTCELQPHELAECPSVIPRFNRQACCWQWSNDDIYQEECVIFQPGFLVNSVTYGIANLSSVYQTTFVGQSTQTDVTVTIDYEIRGSVVNLFTGRLGLFSNLIYTQTQIFPFVPGTGNPQTFTITGNVPDPRVQDITVTSGPVFNFWTNPNPRQLQTHTLSVTENLQLLDSRSSSTSGCLYVEFSGTN